ncbi:hypothetical protein GCM10010987_37170 [Bradyrhizobium guangdongense]|uniref:Uncharacterized protein n=1 Tax=Bradyrhizobium guangdongense TaxID=1325090 RepID=A0AA87W850_9BRAD|nr:hypothetical protein GCM10010987_37170 [Bradyrhizobium guangdongense]
MSTCMIISMSTRMALLTPIRMTMIPPTSTLTLDTAMITIIMTIMITDIMDADIRMTMPTNTGIPIMTKLRAWCSIWKPGSSPRTTFWQQGTGPGSPVAKSWP